jgi:hypothetical protein
MAERPRFTLDCHPYVAEFRVPKQSYLADQPDASHNYIATKTIVLDNHAFSPTLVILQPAASDEDHSKW